MYSDNIISKDLSEEVCLAKTILWFKKKKKVVKLFLNEQSAFSFHHEIIKTFCEAL